MHAVLIEVDVSGVDAAAGGSALREQIVPAIRQMPGSQSGTWLTGNEAGRGLSLTVWATEADAQAMVNAFGVGSAPSAAASVIRCELREVAASV